MFGTFDTDVFSGLDARLSPADFPCLERDQWLIDDHFVCKLSTTGKAN